VELKGSKESGEDRHPRRETEGVRQIGNEVRIERVEVEARNKKQVGIKADSFFLNPSLATSSLSTHSVSLGTFSHYGNISGFAVYWKAVCPH